MNWLKRIRNNKGMTLVETVIAIFIISVSVLTIFGTLAAATNMMSRAVEYKKAVDEGLYLLTDGEVLDGTQTDLMVTDNNTIVISLSDGSTERKLENIRMIKSNHSSGEVALIKLTINLARYDVAVALSTTPTGVEFDLDRE